MKEFCIHDNCYWELKKRVLKCWVSFTICPQRYSNLLLVLKLIDLSLLKARVYIEVGIKQDYTIGH